MQIQGSPARGWLIFTPPFEPTALRAEERVVLDVVRSLERATGKSLFLDPASESATPAEPSLSNVSLRNLSPVERIIAKGIVKACVACHPDFQSNAFNPSVLQKAAAFLGSEYYIGTPHLRLHLANDRMEESLFHSDSRRDSGQTITHWTPLLDPLPSQELMCIPNTHLLNPYGKWSARLLKVMNLQPVIARRLSKRLPIKRGQTLLFSARLWHRGDLNRQKQCFASRVIRMSQHPFAEQGYGRVQRNAQGALEFVPSRSYVSYSAPSLDELTARVWSEACAFAASPGPSPAASTEAFLKALGSALQSSERTPERAVEAVAWAEMSIYFNAAKEFKPLSPGAAEQAVRRDPRSGGTLVMLLSAFPGKTAADFAALFDLLFARLTSAESLAVAANFFGARYLDFARRLRQRAHEVDSHYPAAV